MTVEESVKEHIETELIADRKMTLGLDTSLNGLVDSSGVLELAMWIETTFGISVELDRISAADFASVRSLSDWIRANITGGGP